jgi:hypothetical protein
MSEPSYAARSGPGLVVGADYSLIAGSGCGRSLPSNPKLLDLGLREVLDAYEGVLRGAGPDELIQLGLDSHAVPVF